MGMLDKHMTYGVWDWHVRALGIALGSIAKDPDLSTNDKHTLIGTLGSMQNAMLLVWESDFTYTFKRHEGGRAMPTRTLPPEGTPPERGDDPEENRRAAERERTERERLEREARENEERRQS